MKAILRAFQYAPTMLIRAIVSFGTVFAFTRLLAPEDYGRYSLYISVIALIQMLFFTWIESSVLRFLVRAKKRNWLHRMMGTFLVPAAVGTGILLIAVSISYFVAPIDITLGLLACVAASIIGFLNKIREEALIAEERSRHLFIFDAGIKLGSFAIGVLIAFQTDWGSVSPILGLAFAGLLAFIIDMNFWQARPKFGRFQPGILRHAAVYGLPLSVALIAEQILNSGDRFVIAAMLGEADVGAYAAGYGVASQIIGLIFTALGTSLAPIAMQTFDQDGPEATIETMRPYGIIMVAIGVPAAAGLMLVAGPLSTILIGEALRETARDVIVWITPTGVLVGLMSFYHSMVMNIVRRTQTLAVIIGIVAVLNIGLNILLIPHFALFGAVLATIIAYVVALGITIMVARRFLKLDLLLLPIAKALLCAGAMAVAVKFAPLGGIENPFLQLIGIAGVGGGVYLVLAWVVGLFDHFLPGRLMSPVGRLTA